MCTDGDGVVLCSRSEDGRGEVVAEFMESHVVHLPRVSRDSLLALHVEKVLDGLPMILYSCLFQYSTNKLSDVPSLSPNVRSDNPVIARTEKRHSIYSTKLAQTVWFV